MFSWNRQHFLLDGKPFYFASGEVHCYRVDKSQWRDRFAKLKASGAEAVATYFPWRFHEPQEGVFCFDKGDGITDISEYCRTASEEGLKVIVRPGPYSYSELMEDGLPEWLLEKYPEVLAQRACGSEIHYSAISYLHPVLLEKVKRFYAEICKVLVPHLVTNGGNIILFQLDNETGGVHIWRDSLDYHPATCGFGDENGRYPLFLKERYGTVDAVNRAYGTAAESLKDVDPRIASDNALYRWRMENDYGDFYCQMLAEYMKTLKDFAVENGINVPFCQNTGNLGLTGFFRESAKLLGKDFIVGSDHYWNLNQDWPQNNPTPQKLVENFLSCGMMNCLGYPAWVPEFQYGSIAQWPPVTAQDLKLSLFAHLAFGLQGHNGYVFAGGANPGNSCWSCRIYDYDAPVAADGTLRPTYDSIKELDKFIRNNPDILTSKPAADIAVVMDWESWRPGCQADYKDVAGRAKMRSHMKQTVLSTIFAAGLVPEMISPEAKFDFGKVLCVLCGGTMRKALQRKLADFVFSGGKLMIWGAVPQYDENLNSCTVLADVFGIPASRLAKARYGGVDFNGSEDAHTSGELFVPSEELQQAVVLSKESRTGDIAAYIKPVGSGCVMVNGALFKLVRFSHAEYISYLFRALGGKEVFVNGNPWVMTMRRVDDSNNMWLFVINASTSKQSVTFKLKDHEEKTIGLAPMEIKIFCEDQLVF